MTDEQIIDAILKREGGYSNHAEDRGGATNHGITIKTLSEWRGRPATAEDVMGLTEDEARAIYRQRYIVDPGLFKVKDDRLRAFLVDSAVNHGPKNAIKFMQRGLGIEDDGVFGSDTFLALVGADPEKLFRKVFAERAKFYGRLITSDASQAKFASGWMNRLSEFLG